jgi:hypothetical protein
MADNVPITAGSGTSIATDQIGSDHYQKVKLTVGVADDATMIGHKEDSAHTDGDGGIMALGVRKDAATALAVDGDYIPSIFDSQGRQWVRPAPVQVRISVTPTIDTAAYTTGDCIGGLMTFSNAVRISGGSGIIQSVLVLDKTQAQRAAIDLLFFDRSVTWAGNNAAVAMSDADMAYCLGVIPIGPYNTAWPGTPANSFSTLINVGLPFILSGTDLFVGAVVRGTPTYVAASDLVFTLGILQD